MIFSWILGILIFSYAAYTFVRHIKRGKEGECAKCSMNKSCGTVNMNSRDETCK